MEEMEQKAEMEAGNAAERLPSAGARTETVGSQVVVADGGAAAIGACAENLAEAAKALETVLEKVHAQYEALNAKVDRIIAMVEAGAAGEGKETKTGTATALLPSAGAGVDVPHTVRRTLPAPYLRLLAKNGVEDGVESEALNRALGGLSVEQRIAVKSELLRAGLVR